MTGTTKYRNCHIVVKTYNNVIFVVKLLVVVKAFKILLGCDLGDNGETLNIDLFQKRMVEMARSIFLQNYILRAQKNWK